jgi:hypothetical protein
MKPNPEITIVPKWETVWWDLRTEAEFQGIVTGTPWNPYPTEFLEQRRIERIGGSKMHVDCGGIVELRWTTRWEGMKAFSTFWDECTQCGKRWMHEE